MLDTLASNWRKIRSPLLYEFLVTNLWKLFMITLITKTAGREYSGFIWVWGGDKGCTHTHLGARGCPVLVCCMLTPQKRIHLVPTSEHTIQQWCQKRVTCMANWRHVCQFNIKMLLHTFSGADGWRGRCAQSICVHLSHAGCVRLGGYRAILF